MAVLFEIVGSIVIGGLLLLNIIRLNAQVTDEQLRSTLRDIAQRDVLTLGDVLRYDLLRAGNGVTNVGLTPPIVTANPNEIAFNAAYDSLGAGTVIRVRYYTQPNTATPDPTDFKIFRYRNTGGGETTLMAESANQFDVTYYNASGMYLGGAADGLTTVTTAVASSDLQVIARIRVAIEAKNPIALDDASTTAVDERKLTQAEWITTVAPPNLNRLVN